jgi:hypothetical protein
MSVKNRFFHGRLVGALFVLSLLQASSAQGIRPDDLAKKYPGIEGIYEMTVPGQGAVAVQVYFKDGTLRTVTAGDAESTTFDPVAGQELRVTKVSSDKGTFQFEFLRTSTATLRGSGSSTRSSSWT